MLGTLSAWQSVDSLFTQQLWHGTWLPAALQCVSVTRVTPPTLSGKYGLAIAAFTAKLLNGSHRLGITLQFFFI